MEPTVADVNDTSSTTNATDTTDTSNTTTTADQAALSSLSIPVDHLVIAAVQIAGAATDDDFVKIYNPTQGAVDVSGWKLRKKSSTGTDSSLREFPAGSTIPVGGYFVMGVQREWVRGSINADVSSTETLAANNSVALFDGSGTQIDGVAWGTGTDQYVEGAAYQDSPLANQVLSRKFTDGIVVDTDDNAADFTL